MAKVSKKSLEQTLESRLRLKKPRFILEKLPSGRISGSVVSDSFRSLSDSDRQERIWAALEKEFGATSTQVVGTLLAYTDAEWDVALIGD